MIVDTSAIVAVLRAEPDAAAYAQALTRADVTRISAATYLETGIIVDANRQPLLSHRLDGLLLEVGVVVEPVTAEHAKAARAAYRDFGKGSGSPARLNFGDCFSYALARTTGEPLLYKGDDFVHTDIWPALPPADGG